MRYHRNLCILGGASMIGEVFRPLLESLDLFDLMTYCIGLPGLIRL